MMSSVRLNVIVGHHFPFSFNICKFGFLALVFISEEQTPGFLLVYVHDVRTALRSRLAEAVRTYVRTCLLVCL